MHFIPSVLLNIVCSGVAGTCIGVLVTLFCIYKPWKKINFVSARSRRERYEFLKAEISKRHFAGFKGLIVNFPRKFDAIDIGSFKPPMYQVCKNADNCWCIFWDPAKMTKEIGAGAPLQDGESFIPSVKTKINPDPSLIDENKPIILKNKEYEVKNG